MSAVPTCYYGSPEPLPVRRALRAGPLSLEYDNGDLRYIRLGDREVIRRWYVSVRDQSWGTVAARLAGEVVEAGPDHFRITYEGTNRHGDIDFHWTASIIGTADASITFRMEGVARATFQRNRIGFCVLHPIEECRGARCLYELGDGTSGDGRFPRFVAPFNPFRELKAFAHEVAPGVWAELRFEGDLFEMEDQRNWTDASFKTFCTPLRIPFPVEVPAGTQIAQSVTLTVQNAAARARVDARRTPMLSFRETGLAARLPAIGLCHPAQGGPAEPRTFDLLRKLRPAHLRVDLDLTSERWVSQLADAWEEALALRAPMELAITCSDQARKETDLLIGALQEHLPALARVLTYHRDEWATPVRILTQVVEAFSRFDAFLPIYAGTAANFAELNRSRPPLGWLDGVCYSIHPQEHAFDNASLVECCAAIADTAVSARSFCGNLPLAITPITLRKRVNPYAGAAPQPAAGAIPPTVDRRQMSLFGAAWTLGSLKYLAESGVGSVTYYETIGWRGVLEHPHGCPLPAQFPSQPGMVFPLFHVLADANEFAEAEVLPAASNEPLCFDGLALRSANGTRVLAANMTGEPAAVVVNNLGSTVRLRVLDENTFVLATRTPEAFRADPGAECSTTAGRLELNLRPYAYARIDTP